MVDQTACRVRFVPENVAEQPRVFDFTDWAVSPPLREAFAAAFAARTRIGGRVRTVESAEKTWRTLRRFTAYLAGLASPPASAGQLTAAQLKGWYLPRQQHRGGPIELGELKTTLRQVEGISAEFVAALRERNPPRVAHTPRRSYSRSENQRILNAARRDIRRAAQRIRGNRVLLLRWRAGELDTAPVEVQRLGELFDYVDRHTDVPRSQNRDGAPMRWVSRLGTVAQHLTALHLSALDAAAFAVLLVGLTGQNKGSILTAPAAHHRPDGYAADAIASAIVELDKPRRGSRRHMDVPLTSVPSWAAPPDPGGAPAGQPGRDRQAEIDLQSPFGVYMLLHELATPARHLLGSDRLLVWWAGHGHGAGLRTRLHSDLVLAWSSQHDLLTDAAATAPGGVEQLVVTLSRLRLTYISCWTCAR